MTRRGSRDCRHATLNRPCAHISHSGVTEQEHTDVQAATHIGGTVRVLLSFPITQRHALDRRNLESVLPLLRCDWSAGGFGGRGQAVQFM